jgi:hypothetical protein
LHEQLLDGRSEEEFVRFLLLHNQDAVSIPDDDGWLPLHFACMWRPLSIVKLVYDACPMHYTDKTMVGELLWILQDVRTKKRWLLSSKLY